MMMRVLFFFADILLINAGFLLSFLIRYGPVFPRYNFLPYKHSFVFLTLIYISTLLFFKVYKATFKSSWVLFGRVFLGFVIGTLFSVAFVYVFRIKWGAFPTSVFILSFFINLLLIFKLHQYILKAKKRIRKKVIVIGQGRVDDIVGKRVNVERRNIDEIGQLIKYADTDEIIISEKFQNQKDLNLLIYLLQRLKINVVFSLSVYMELLPEQIDKENQIDFLRTFFGKKSDEEEFLIRTLDIAGSVLLLFVCIPVIIFVSLLIKITSPGPVLYKQQRVGKDGKVFTLYKFRTMVKDAEKVLGLAPTLEKDPRVTKVGKWLRRTRLDELPQLINVLKGEMSLVGPRPENLYRVENHKALQGIRLAVEPGITGLAQVRGFYDLQPKHKIKYDYLYIQRRSFLLNLYILAKTVPVVFSSKGW